MLDLLKGLRHKEIFSQARKKGFYGESVPSWRLIGTESLSDVAGGRRDIYKKTPVIAFYYRLCRILSMPGIRLAMVHVESFKSALRGTA